MPQVEFKDDELALVNKHFDAQEDRKYFDLHGLMDTIIEEYPGIDPARAKSWGASLSQRVAESVADPADHRVGMKYAGYERVRIKSRGNSLAYLRIE